MYVGTLLDVRSMRLLNFSNKLNYSTKFKANERVLAFVTSVIRCFCLALFIKEVNALLCVE